MFLISLESLSDVFIDEKLLKERLALAYLACLIRPVNPSFADEIEELWSEFEAGDSKTAQLVRSVDALECMHQAVVYEERSQLVKDLGEFMELETKVSASELRDWAKCLKQERDTLWSSKVTQDLTFLFVLGILLLFQVFPPSKLTALQEALA